MPARNPEDDGQPSKLGHLIYSSTAGPGFDESSLETILEATRRNNSKKAITGLLLFSSGYFFQVLEGEPEVIRELFKVISADDRHRNVTLIIQEPVANRAFANWTMAYVRAESSELEELVEEGKTLGELNPGRARKLLSAFIKGRWRARLTNSS